MRLSQPKKKVFLISVIAAAVALVAFIVSFFVEPMWVLWASIGLLFATYLLLAASVSLKGI